MRLKGKQMGWHGEQWIVFYKRKLVSGSKTSGLQQPGSGGSEPQVQHPCSIFHSRGLILTPAFLQTHSTIQSDFIHLSDCSQASVKDVRHIPRPGSDHGVPYYYNGFYYLWHGGNYFWETSQGRTIMVMTQDGYSQVRLNPSIHSQSQCRSICICKDLISSGKS